MALWTDLKAAVAAIVKTNGNQEITGANLQATLNSIIDNIGENASYSGIAIPTTNPGTPDGPKFYLATEPGIYANFGGITLVSGELYVFEFLASSWVGHKLIDDRVNRISDITMKLGSAYLSQNLIGNEFEIGSLSGADGSETVTAIRIRTKGFVELTDVTDKLILSFVSNNFNVLIYWYDATQTFISTEGGYRDSYKEIFAPSNCKYVRCIFQWRDNTSQVFTESYLDDLGVSLLPNKFHNEVLFGEVRGAETMTSKIGKHYSDINLVGEEFESGTILAGVDSPSTIRFRTAGFVELGNPYEKLKLIFLNNLFEVIISWYDESQIFISNFGYYSANTEFVPPNTAKYVRCTFKYGSAGTENVTTGFIEKLGISMLPEKYFNRELQNYLINREYNIEQSIATGINKDAINIGKIYTNNSISGDTLTLTQIRLLSELIEVDNLAKYLIRYNSNSYTALVVQYDINGSYIGQTAYGDNSFITDGAHFIRVLIRRIDEGIMDLLDSVYAGIEVIKDNSYNFTGNYLPANEDYWEQGSIVGGVESPTTSRLRTGKIPFVGGNYFALEFQSATYTVAINAYDKDDNWLGYLINYSTTNARIFVDEVAYIRLVSKRQDEATPMYPSMMNSLGITFSRDNNWFSGIDATKTDLIKINAMSNNVGLFNQGVAPIGIPPAELTQGIIDWKELIAENQQDIIFMQELPNFVDDAETLDTYETLYEDIYPYFAQLDTWTGIASKYPFVVTENTLSTGRRWLSAKINVQGEEIAIACLHLSPGETADANRATEIAEILAFFTSDEKVIIGADLNTWTTGELDPFRNAGYSLANWGYFGTLRTYLHADEAFDNILVKGGKINKGVASSLIATSDHYPIHCKISF